MNASSSPANTLECLAQLNKAAGDPLRLSILQLLGQGAFGVLELCDIFAIKQSSMSHHLKVLAQAGLVSTQREGNSIFYRRPLLTERSPLAEWQQTLFSTLDRTSEEYSASAVAQVMNERAVACEEFFAKHAHILKEQQDLIASHEQYGHALSKLLTSLKAAKQITNHGEALEIGPGEGLFLQDLAHHFQQVTALDISRVMLEQSQKTASALHLKNVRYVLGDTRFLLKQEAEKYEFIVANMVLHHVPSPRTIFQDVAQLLTPGGTLLITDLCRHEQSWAKDSCGDLWLGFETEDLTQWANDAGLHEGQSQFLGLRSGFQIQFRLFNKLNAKP